MSESLDNSGNYQKFSFKYQWTVDDFQICCGCGTCCQKSPEFLYQYNEHVKAKMQIILYPCGKDKTSELIALYLASKNDFEVNVKCSFYFPNVNVGGYIMTMENQKFKPNDIQGASTRIKRNDIVDQLSISNYKLKIVCEMYQTNDVIFNSLKLKTLNDFDKLLKNPDFCDVTIKANGKVFQVHKAILCARSMVFEKMLKIDMKEKKENLLEIEDIKHEIIEEMLKFIYTGEVNNLEKNAEDLLVAADKYALEGLIDICSYNLSQSITLDNAVNLLLLSDRHNLELLKMRTINFISDNVKNIIKKPEFKLLENSPKMLLDLYYNLAMYQKNSITTGEASFKKT